MLETAESVLVNRTLRPVIDVLHEGHRGWMTIGENLADQTVKAFFLRESRIRAQFAAELENELHRRCQYQRGEDSETAQASTRVWGRLAFPGADDDFSLLETAEQGEDDAQKAFRTALEADLPGDLQGVIERQRRHIVAARNVVRGLWDGFTLEEILAEADQSTVTLKVVEWETPVDVRFTGSA